MRTLSCTRYGSRTLAYPTALAWGHSAAARLRGEQAAPCAVAAFEPKAAAADPVSIPARGGRPG